MEVSEGGQVDKGEWKWMKMNDIEWRRMKVDDCEWKWNLDIMKDQGQGCH